MDSMKNQNVSTALVCPRQHHLKENFRLVKYRDSPIIVVPLDTFDKTEDNGSQYEDSIFTLIWCNEMISIWCSHCRRKIDSGYYLRGRPSKRMSKRNTIAFHKDCIEPMVKNPYHPKHSLQVLTYFDDTLSNKRCYCCYFYKQSFRYCSICDFRICYECVQKQVVLTIDHKKRHEHTLSYICREASMTCDICGLDDRRYFIYVCHQCDFVVHKECIYFPFLVKISRHEHRLAFTSSFLIRELFCGVCRENFDDNYGGYSCVKGCPYVVHSKCVVYGDVWDKKELEGKPEDAYENITPFKVISEGIIQHFSHDHYMILQEKIDDKAKKENNCCQACTLPIYEGDIYSCMECDFVLHKLCAYLPLKKEHVMHRHPLVLRNGSIQTSFHCSACRRVCNSFRYNCETLNCYFKLDMHCASVSEPVLDRHTHPLVLPSNFKSETTCSICERNEVYRLKCGECDFVLCFRCASLPKKIIYKHDEHPLIFSFQQGVRNQYWCDICENKIYQYGIYMCIDCNVTVHIECLLGEDMHMLPSKMLKDVTVFGEEINYDALLNSHRITRQICKRCHKRCPDKIFYKIDHAMYCSIFCLYQATLCSNEQNTESDEDPY